MARTIYLTYHIHLTNEAQVRTLQDTNFGLTFLTGLGTFKGRLKKAPTVAAVDYAAPIQEETTPFTSPSIRSPWFGKEFNFPRNVQTFERKSGGWFGLGSIFGATTRYYWIGRFVFSPATAAPVPGFAAGAMATRRWIDGGEMPPFGEGPVGNGHTVGRAGSRHLQGLGYHFDGLSSGQRSHTPTEAGGAASAEQWERFYCRFRRFSTASTRIWTCNTAAQAFAGCALNVLPTGQLTLTNIDNAGVETVVASTSTPIPVHTWKKVDILFRYGASAMFKLFINGVLQFSAIPTGLTTVGNISQTSIGANTVNTLAWDVDDWIGADLPTESAPGSGIYTGHDWNRGSRVALVAADGFGSDNSGNWAGDWRIARQRPVQNSVPPTFLTSSTSGARLTLDTDAGREVDNQPGALGVAAMIVGLYSSRVGGDGTLGYRLPSASAVMSAIVQSGSLTWTRAYYVPAGVVTPLAPLAGLELLHDKGASGTSSSVQALMAAVEVIGIFGPEDVVRQTTSPTTLPDPPPPFTALHHAPYPQSPWARKTPPTISPVIIHAGTYTGNGTFQDLAFRCPIHLLFIRPLTGSTGGVYWWSSCNAPHRGGNENFQPEGPVEVIVDPLFNGGNFQDDQEQQTIARIVGADVNSNAAGVTYQFLAISDPGMRFTEAGALDVYGGTADYVNSLANEQFTPECAFVQVETHGAAGSAKLRYKGPGHAASAISPLDATEIATGLSFSNGTLTSKSGLYVSGADQIAFIAFRRTDGSNDAGVPRVLQLASYTGDGSASRTINLAPLSGRRPLWAMVVPHNGAAYLRDPSHTGTNSLIFPTTNSASSGITSGAIDQISVGSGLNANGIVYDVFVIPGDTVAGNNGWSQNGEFAPVEPTAPFLTIDPNDPYGSVFDPYLDEPVDVPVVAPVVEPGFTSSPDFQSTCVDASTKIVNQALTRIGVSKRVNAIATEQSEEAAAARLHYRDDVAATLRDFPWPFATRYATLTLVAGTAAVPVNGDWTYSYRVPTDMMFARRIVNASTRRAFDPNPPVFRVGSDATGGLIYTDESPVELEYTIRMDCPASQGDALFREALTWRLAHSFAPVLAKDEKKVVFCWAKYQEMISRARVAASNEAQHAPDGDAGWITGR